MTTSRAISHRLLSWYKLNRGWLGYLTVFVMAFLFFAYFQYVPVFADPDSFYHAKIAVLFRDGTFLREFTALPYTTLAQSFADHHFLYHLLLIPFVSVTDPLIGLKLATILFGSLLALTFYWFIRRWQVPWAFVATVILLLVSTFTFRMNLAKASSLSVTLLLLGLATAFSYKPKLLGILAFAYVWFYGGFLLLAVCVLTFAAVSALHRRFVRREDGNQLLQRIRALLGRAFRRQVKQRMNLRLAVAVLIGISLGVVINPFFPGNMKFYLDQVVRIGAVNYQKAIGVGGEWYPYGFVELVANTVLVSIPLVVAIVLFVLFFRRQSARSITLFCLWLFFLFLTLKSRRYIEYYVPFALLFAVFSLHDTLKNIRWRAILKSAQQTFLQKTLGWLGAIALVTYIAILLPTVVIRDLVTEKKDLASGFPIGVFSEESEWIRTNGQPGAVVFHSDWDEFPVLFYYNSASRYIAGLDPTFLYLADQDRYWKWANVTLGQEKGDVWSIVRGTFDADFVFVERGHTPMKRLIDADSRFSLAYEGPDAFVYTVARN